MRPCGASKWDIHPPAWPTRREGSSTRATWCLCTLVAWRPCWSRERSLLPLPAACASERRGAAGAVSSVGGVGELGTFLVGALLRQSTILQRRSRPVCGGARRCVRCSGLGCHRHGPSLHLNHAASRSKTTCLAGDGGGVHHLAPSTWHPHCRVSTRMSAPQISAVSLEHDRESVPTRSCCSRPWDRRSWRCSLRLCRRGLRAADRRWRRACGWR